MKYIKREIENFILKNIDGFPVILITGPRQSGKTTLVKNLFKNYDYISLENLDYSEFAKEDPKGFLEKYSKNVIFDEIQNVPSLISYIQGIVDEERKPATFVLTGSRSFNLMSNISQSLAGRVLNVNLLPFEVNEVDKIGNTKYENYEDFIYRGGYPPIYVSKVNPSVWYSSYVTTYIERDVRQIVNIKDLGRFRNFLRLLAGRIGKTLNFSNLASDTGVSHNTIREWISVLEASFIVFLLNPYFENIRKRIIKHSKLYFYDTGLVSYLLGIREPQEIFMHYLKGELFENFIVAELTKKNLHTGGLRNFYFLREKSGVEIDFLCKKVNQKFNLIEIKSSKTFNSEFFKNIEKVSKYLEIEKSFVIYGGKDSFKFKGNSVFSWRNIDDVFEELK